MTDNLGHAVAENNSKIQRLESILEQCNSDYQKKISEYEALRTKYALLLQSSQTPQQSPTPVLDAASLQDIRAAISDLQKIYEGEKVRSTTLFKRLLPLVEAVETQLTPLYQSSTADRSEPLSSLRTLKALESETESDIQVTQREMDSLNAMISMKSARIRELQFTSERQWNETQETGKRETDSKSQSIAAEKAKWVREIEELRKANQKQAEILKARVKPLEAKVEKGSSPNDKNAKVALVAKVPSAEAEILFKERTARRQEIQKLSKILADEQKRLAELIAGASSEKKRLDARKKEHQGDIVKLEKQLRVAWTKKITADQSQEQEQASP